MLENYLDEKDFINIRFIDAELKWYTRDDFLNNCKTIKQLYKKMKYNEKQIYKWYCYANINITMYQKNKIWDYLNGSINLNQCREALNFNGSNYRGKNEFK